MNFANLMHLTNLELGLIILEGSIVLSFFLTLIYVRRVLRPGKKAQPSHSHPGPFKEWVRDAEAICATLSKNVEEKREIASRLISQLDERIRTLQVLLKKTEVPGKAESRQDLNARISQMREEGYDVSEISRQLRLPKDEIQLALDLKRYRQ